LARHTDSWGVIQAALVKESLSEVSTLSFVGSLTTACVTFLAIMNARIVSGMGAQRVGFLGVTLLGVGKVLAGFAVNNVGALFATVGVVMGVGTRYFTSFEVLKFCADPSIACVS
jgi:hypothetical protein